MNKVLNAFVIFWGTTLSAIAIAALISYLSGNFLQTDSAGNYLFIWFILTGLSVPVQHSTWTSSP